MGEARQIESGAFGVESVAENFFADSVYDSRFLSSDYSVFPPDHAIQNHPIRKHDYYLLLIFINDVKVRDVVLSFNII